MEESDSIHCLPKWHTKQTTSTKRQQTKEINETSFWLIYPDLFGEENDRRFKEEIQIP